MSPERQKYPLSTFIGILLLGAFIQAASALKGDPIVFPDLPSILRSFIRLLTQPNTYIQILTTVRHLLITLLISMLMGTAIGLVEGLTVHAEHLLRPLMMLIRSLPMIVLIILVMVSTNYAYVPVIASTLMLVPVISEAVMEGCRVIPQELLDVYRMNTELNGYVLIKVYLPMMAGYLRQAFTEAMGTGMKLVITTEYMVQTRSSLGKAIYSSAYFNEYADIFAYALLMVLIILLFSELPRLILRKISE